MLAGEELAVAGADAEEAGADVAGADDEEDEEEDDELLQLAAARPRRAMPTTAANRLFDDLKGSIPRR